MDPVVKMNDAEAAVVAFLDAQLAARPEPYAASVVVSTRTPNPVPARYVRVRRVGGVTGSVVLDRPRIDCLVWAADDAERIDLAQLVHALLLAIAGDTAGGVLLYSATDFLAPIQVPDPIDPTRTVAMLTVELAVRGTQV